MDDKMAGFEDQINILKSASSTPRVEQFKGFEQKVFMNNKQPKSGQGQPINK